MLKRTTGTAVEGVQYAGKETNKKQELLLSDIGEK